MKYKLCKIVFAASLFWGSHTRATELFNVLPVAGDGLGTDTLVVTADRAQFEAQVGIKGLNNYPSTPFLGFICKWGGPDFDALWGHLPAPIDAEAVQLGIKTFSAQTLSGVQLFGIGVNPDANPNETMPHVDGLLLSLMDSGLIDDTQPKPCVLVPTDRLVPDRVNILEGQYINDDMTGGSLWQEDDRELRINPEQRDGFRIEVDLGYSLTRPFVDGLFFSIVARAESAQPGAIGILNVEAYNFRSGQFSRQGSFVLSALDEKLTLELSAGDKAGLSDFIDPKTGSVHLHLQFIQNGSQTATLVLDMAQLQMFHGTSGDGEHF